MDRFGLKKKLLFLLESRATLAYSKNIIKNIIHFKNLSYKTIVSGAHLDIKFGKTISEIRKNKITISEKISFKTPTNIKNSWSFNAGDAIKKYSKALHKIKPDIVVLTGDRIETFAMCIACTYMDIKVAHVQAGDKSGHVDDIARNAIAKLANIHFTSCNDSSNRLKSFNEKKEVIYNVGAPQLDDIMEFIKKKNKIPIIKGEYFLIIYHPVFNQISNLKKNLERLIKGVLKFDKKIYMIYPNNDFGHQIILNAIKKFKNKIYLIKNVERENFLNLLYFSEGLIGNSSCGIIESPSLNLRVLNIGNRQQGRLQAKNILNIEDNFSIHNLVKKINFMINNRKFNNLVKNTKNYYYKKNSGYKICKVLNEINLKDKKFNKY